MAAAPPGLVIRATTTADVPALCALANEPGYRGGTLRLPYQTVEETGRWFAALGPNDHPLVAVLDGEVVGNIGLHRQRGRRFHVGVLGMGVRDSLQRRGIGTALLAAVVDLADNWLDLRRLELTVFVDNPAGIALYTRFGFVREGVLRAYAYRAGAYVDALTMARLRGLS
jgi:putative acetyltransferase